MTVVNCLSSYMRALRLHTPTAPWATFHDASAADDIWTTHAREQIATDNTSPNFDSLYRAIITFNTSTTYIPVGATLISAQIHLKFADYRQEFAAAPTINIYGATPADPNAYVIGDFDQLGTTLFCDTPQTPAVGEMTFTLNAAGLAAINHGAADSRTVMTYRSNWDALDSPPAWEVSKNYWLYGTSLAGDPILADFYLIVTYTLVTVATNAATNITQVSAQLNGTLTNTGAEVAYVSFDWGLTSSYGNSTLEEAKLGSGTFNKVIGNNLTPDTTYHFRAKARIGTYTAYGSDLTFRTGTPTLSADSPIRVTSIVHRWSAGPEPVYQAEVYIGGLQSSYLPPISDKEPLPSITPREPTAAESLAAGKRLGIAWTGTAMSQTNALFQYGVWLSQHTAREINAIFKHQPSFAEWWAWYQVYGRQP